MIAYKNTSSKQVLVRWIGLDMWALYSIRKDGHIHKGVAIGWSFADDRTGAITDMRRKDFAVSQQGWTKVPITSEYRKAESEDALIAIVWAKKI